MATQAQLKAAKSSIVKKPKLQDCHVKAYMIKVIGIYNNK